MPNVRGPRSSKRRLYVAAMISCALCCSGRGRRSQVPEVWTGAAADTEGAPIRMTRAYRTASSDALCVKAGIPSIKLLIDKRIRIPKEENIDQQKVRTCERWHEGWDNNEVVARWTKTLIPNIKKWKDRKHGELSYQLTQVLSGHGCFRDYLYKKRASSNLSYDCAAIDDIGNAVFVCPRWAEERSVIAILVGEDVTVNNLLNSMLEDGEKWRGIQSKLEIMITIKEKKEGTPYPC